MGWWGFAVANRNFPFGPIVAPGSNGDAMKEILRLLLETTGILLTDFVDDLIGNGDDEA